MLKFLGAVSLLLLSNMAAFAQVHVGHTRSPHSGSRYLSTDAPPPLDSSFSLSFGTRLEQSVLTFSSPDTPDVDAIKQRLISSLAARISIFDKLDLLAQGQLLSGQDGAGLSPTSPLAQDPTLGRTRVALRWSNKLDSTQLVWAIQPGVMSPSSNRDPLFGGPDFVPTLAVLLTKETDTIFNWSSVIQYEHRSERMVGQLTDAPVWSLDFAVSVRLLPALEALAETHLMHHAASEPINTASIDVGARVAISDPVTLKVGMTTGLMAAPGTPARTFLLGLDFIPSDSNKTPAGMSPTHRPEAGRAISDNITPMDGSHPSEGRARRALPTDRDRDGLVDADDACPLLPEDVDGHQDSDGCPDYDNDHDGHLDSVDESPLYPEDYDGYEDHDGRPEPDNDGDGLSDGEDRCPDHSGVGDGCPESIFDWRAHIARFASSTPIMSVTENTIFITADASNGSDSTLKAFNHRQVVEDIAEWLQTHHNWARMNVMGSYCYETGRGETESAALKSASQLTDALISLGVSSNRIGYLAVGRYAMGNDNCQIQLFIKRLENFEGIGNQQGDTEFNVIKSSIDANTKASELLDIRFVPHQDSPTLDTARLLIEFAQSARAQRQTFKIHIHTDALGDPKAKLALSVRRATRLSELLLQLGVPNALFEVVGMGAQSPVADNSTRSGRDENNRVEVIYSTDEEKEP